MEATVKPMIEPPKNATLRASDAPSSFAATAVLTLAFVAVYIPIKPATPEQAAPTKKDIAVSQPKLKNKATMQTMQNNANLLGNMIYNHNNTGCPDLKDSVYLTPTSDEPYDPLPMVCHLAERSGRAHGGSYGFGKLWPSKYTHKKFANINQGS